MRQVFILRNVSYETARSLESYMAEAGVAVRCFDLFRETPRQLFLQEAAALAGSVGLICHTHRDNWNACRLENIQNAFRGAL